MDILLTLDAFFKGAGLYTVVALIVVDVLMGVWAAIKAGVFEWDEVGRFYRTTVVPFLGSYVVLIAFKTFLPAGTLPDLITGIAAPAYALIVANLVASIIGSIKKIGLPAPIE